MINEKNSFFLRINTSERVKLKQKQAWKTYINYGRMKTEKTIAE